MIPSWLTDPRFVDILRCPRSGSSLRWMTGAELTDASQRTQRAWHAGVTTSDGSISYPVEGGIFGLLADLALARGATGSSLSADKQRVQRFYDEFGWQRGDDDKPFGDAKLFEDLRPVAREYIKACHERVNRHLTRPGRYLLDVASGPVQYPEYLAYADGFEYRICVDISRQALIEARKRVGDERALFVLGDITNLPLQRDRIDAVVSLHTIYHVPADEQEQAFLEIHRVLRPDHTAVVVYTWSNAPMTELLLLPAWPIKRVMRWLRRRRRKGEEGGALYYRPHPYSWFANRKWPFPVKLLVWRSLSVLPMRIYLHEWAGGGTILRALRQLEERFPRFMGKIGQYPLIVMEKPGP